MLLQKLFSSPEVKQDLAISHLALDSREVIEGSLFFAYPGTQVDGRDFIAQAIARGAVAIAYENGDGYNLELDPRVTFIPVRNLQAAVGPVAAKFYNQPSELLTLIGVTGTNGKTSVTHFIAQALRAHCAVMGTVGVGLLSNLSAVTHTTLNPIALQRQLAEFKKQNNITHVALEVSSHALDQGRVSGTHFDIAVFTQLSRDHLDYHGDMRSYALAKELLFHQPGLSKAVVNQDDAFGRELIERYKARLELVTYTLKRPIDTSNPYLSATKLIKQKDGFVVGLDTSWGHAEMHCQLLGEFNVSNLLATLGVLLVDGMDFQQAINRCATLKPVTGRMQVFIEKNKPTVVVDYAHTPDALQKALATLREHCEGKLWCVFGCGGNRDPGKRSLMGEAAERLADRVIVTNDNPRLESQQQIVVDIQKGFKKAHQTLLDRAQAIQAAIAQAKQDDIILVAGKGHEAYQLIEGETIKFSDIEQVQKVLRGTS